MQELIGLVALAGLGATTLMVLGVLYFVWLSMNDDHHRSDGGGETT